MAAMCDAPGTFDLFFSLFLSAFVLQGIRAKADEGRIAFCLHPLPIGTVGACTHPALDGDRFFIRRFEIKTLKEGVCDARVAVNSGR